MAWSSFYVLCLGEGHGLCRVIEECAEKVVKRRDSNESESRVLQQIVKTCFCFSVITFAWIFFRAGSISKAKLIIKGVLSGFDFNAFWIESSAMISGFMPNYEWMIIAYLVIVAMAILWIGYLDYYQKYQKMDYLNIISRWSIIQRWVMYYVMIILVMFCFVMTTNEYGKAGAFLYFQF